VERVPERLFIDERIEAHVQPIELPLRHREDDHNIEEHRDSEQRRRHAVERSECDTDRRLRRGPYAILRCQCRASGHFHKISTLGQPEPTGGILPHHHIGISDQLRCLLLTRSNS